MSYCLNCGNTGYEMKPTHQEEFDREDDRLFDLGVMEGYLCYKRACEKTGFIRVPCTECEKGRKIQKELDKKDN